MIEILKKFKGLLIAIAVIVLAFIAYNQFVPKSSDQDQNALVRQNTDTTSGTSIDDGPGKEFVNQLLAIQDIHFKIEILTDPAYLSLQDFSKELIPQPVGRPNPFAPLGEDELSAANAALNSSSVSTTRGFIKTSGSTSTTTTPKPPTR